MKKLFSILTATLLTVSQLGGVANIVKAEEPEGIDCTNVVSFEGLKTCISEGIEVSLGESFEITENLVIPEGKSITLDLNGKNLQTHNKKTSRIVVEGELTLIDSVGEGKIYSTDTYSQGGNTSLLEVSGKFTMESGIIEAFNTEDPVNNGEFGVGVNGNGIVIVNGGEIKVGWYAISGNGSDANQDTTVEVNGGKLISTADYAIYQPQGGTVTINEGAYVYGAAGAISMNRGNLIVNGGDLISNGDGDTNDCSDGTCGTDNSAIALTAEYSDVTAKISGGNIIASEGKPAILKGTSNNVSCEIIGGTFSSDVSEYVVDGYNLILDENGSYTTEKTIQKLVADAENGSTIKLEKDIEITENLVIPEGKSITLDLNGKNLQTHNKKTSRIVVEGELTLIDSVGEGKIYSTDTYSQGGNTSLLEVSGKFTMESGIIEAFNTEDPVNNGEFGVGVNGNGIVIVNGGEIKVGWYAISGNGSDANQDTTVEVNGGKLISTADYAIYQPQGGTVTINEGAYVYGAAGAISMNRGNLIVNGGDLISNGDGDTNDCSDGTCGTDNSAIALTAKYSDVTAKISGGNIIASEGKPAILKGTSNNVSCEIIGGTFSSDVSEYVVDGYNLILDENGSYTTEKTIQKLVADAENGSTIKLEKDIEITENLVIPEGKSITLDLNGKNLQTHNKKTSRIVVEGELTLIDSVGEGKIYSTDTYSQGGNTSLLEVSGKFTMESGIIEAFNTEDPVNNGEFGVGVNGNGIVIVNGGEIKVGWYAISGNGSDANQDTTVEVNGGKLISTADYAIYQPQGGTVTINEGAYVYGAAGAISMNRGNLIVNGGDLISNGDGDTNDCSDGTCGTDNSAIALTAKYSDVTAKISGGNIIASEGKPAILKGTSNNVSCEIIGGTFSSDVSEYVVDGYIAAQDGNMYKIVKASYTVTFDDSTVSENDKVAEVAYNGKVSAPSVSKSCYSLDGWYNGETKYDFDAPVAEDLILKAKWTYTCGGGGGGSSVKKEEPKTEDKVAEEYAEETFGYDEATETPEATILDSVDYTAPDEQSLADFTETILAALADDADVLARIEAGLASLADSEMDQELKDAYQYALLRGITTMDSIEKADLDRGMTRAEMAKMLAVFAQKVLGKEVLKSDTPSYADLGEMEGDLPGYIQLAYQLQIMGIDAKGNPLENFNLHALVTRAEFATVLSRVLFGDAFNQEGTYYEKHLEALKAAGILTNTDPNMEEMRGWVMLMMMRTENVK